MITFFDPIRSFTFATVTLRLILAMACGGVIGYGRVKRHVQSGMRTYMQIGLGAALCLLITLYEHEMLTTAWADTVTRVGLKFDGARLGSQAVSGIGFLGAALIMKISHQQVRGLTTATGLLCVTALGLASGAGFVECALTAVGLIAIVLNGMAPLENWLRRQAGNISLVVEMDSATDAGRIVETMQELGARVYDVELENDAAAVSALFIVKHPRGEHSRLLCSVAELRCVRSVRELVS